MAHIHVTLLGKVSLFLLLLTGICAPSMAVQAQSDTASSMATALANRNSPAVFEIGTDFQFRNLAGSFTRSADGLMSSDMMSDVQARNLLSSHVQGLIIRIMKGQVTVDNAGYSCTLQRQANGMSIEMARGDTSSTTRSHVIGVIHDNTLVANAEGSTLSIVNKICTGYIVRGDITVSIRPLPKEQWPPMAPSSVTANEAEDSSIVLAWDDPNPHGLVREYDIYRLTGLNGKFSKVATVTGKEHAYTDSSDVAKTEKDMLLYYVVARAGNKKESCPSDVPNLSALLVQRFMRSVTL